jgi:hypothetical protein
MKVVNFPEYGLHLIGEPEVAAMETGAIYQLDLRLEIAKATIVKPSLDL